MGASEPQMSRRAMFKFRLYIAGDAQNSVEALANLTTICRKYLPGLHNIEVMDVFLEPARALTDGIFMTPTLVKLAPAPTRTIIGNLSQTGVVLQALGLEASGA
jgi:circadian clock protein KaiB